MRKAQEHFLVIANDELARSTHPSLSFHSVDMRLTDVEARVLGALVEKEITTPEYYPLSLNALVHACNQKSNRDPLMNLDEDAVRQALRSLNDQAFARAAGSSDSRVPKYEHRLAESFNFTRPEIAILCELLLRGPQTPGELRTRAGRMHSFDDLSVVHTTLKHLMEREPPIVAVLPRQPGTKEARYAHLLSGNLEVAPLHLPDAAGFSDGKVPDDKLALIKEEIAGLRNEVAELRRQFAQFRQQFE